MSVTEDQRLIVGLYECFKKHGTTDEKELAQKKIDEYCSKHNITPEMIELSTKGYVTQVMHQVQQVMSEINEEGLTTVAKNKIQDAIKEKLLEAGQDQVKDILINLGKRLGWKLIGF